MNWNPVTSFRESFRLKIILLSILAMLITCIALTAFFVTRHREALNESLLERGRLLVRVLSNSAKVGIFSENEDLLKDPAGSIAQQPEVTSVSIYNEDGILLYASPASEFRSEIESDAPNSKIDNDLFGQLKTSKSVVHFNGPDSIRVWSAVFSTPGYESADSLFFKENEIRTAPKAIGFIRVAITKESLKNQIYGFLYKALLISTSATAAGALLIFFFIKGITSPLNRLAEGIKAIGADGAAEPIRIDSKDEIGRLAGAFNEMSTSLKKKKAENFQLETRLRQAQKLEALGTFAGGIAHDFNNILTPILGYSEMLLDDLSKNDGIRLNIEEIYIAAGRARDLVKQILAFSRQSNAQTFVLKIQPVLKETLKLLRASIPANIPIVQRIDADCGFVLADPTDIHRIVMNLGANAYYAVKDCDGSLVIMLQEDHLLDGDPRISSLALPPGEYVKLVMKDTGSGMDNETMQKIFDPYFTTKPSGEGTGMGLAVVHGIVRHCGGGILVRSEVGKGSMFEILFPVVKSETASVDSIPLKSLPGGNEHVLLVDDEAQIVFMWKQMLEQLGYSTTVKTSSLEALDAFAANPENFAVIVTDQTMPNMTGDKLASEAMRLREDIPVILCTGFSEKIDEETIRKQGIRALLFKPILRHQLATTVREVLKNGH